MLARLELAQNHSLQKTMCCSYDTGFVALAACIDQHTHSVLLCKLPLLACERMPDTNHNYRLWGGAANAHTDISQATTQG